MWKPGEMEALMRPNPYSSSTIDMCGKRGFGTLFWVFCVFSKFSYCAGSTGTLRVARKAKKKHLQSFGNGFQRTANANHYGIVWKQRTETQRENPRATDGVLGEWRRKRGTVSLRAGAGGKCAELPAGVPVPCAKV